MNPQFTAKAHFLLVFAIAISTGVSAGLSAVGLRGVAFYHFEALLAGICLVQCAALTLTGRIVLRTDTSLLRWILAYVVYTFLSALLLFRFTDVQYGYLVLVLPVFLFYPSASMVLIGVGTSKVEATSDWIKWLGIPACLVVGLGWIQFALKDPLLQVTNSSNESKLVESSLLGTFRPPSFFTSSLDFGLFCLLLFCIACGYGLFSASQATGIVVALVGLSGIAISQTRNVYLCTICAIVTLALLLRFRNRQRGKRLLVLSPLAYLISAVVLMGWAVWNFVSNSLQQTGDLSDASSTWARVSSWQVAWESIVKPSSVLDLAFGFGITQAGHASDFVNLYPIRGRELFLDSTYIQLFLFQGGIGLVLFVVLMAVVWRRLLTHTLSTWDPLAVGTTLFVSVFPACGVFNIVTGLWFGIVLSLTLLVLCYK